MRFRRCVWLIGQSLMGGLFILIALTGGIIGDGHLSAVAQPADSTQLRPVARVPRDQYATVRDLSLLLYPGVNDDERMAVEEGFTFFTTPHTPEEGAGPVANQPFCLGCHRSSEEALPGFGLVTCDPGNTDSNGVPICDTQVSRAARSTPTNFGVTSFNPETGGGVPANDDNAVDGTGRTAAFTIFGDFAPSAPFTPNSPTPFFNGLIEFSGFVQHTRPSLPPPMCLPDPILPVERDPFLQGGTELMTGLSPLGFRRAVGERAGPPYIGRGLMEAVPEAAIMANADVNDERSHCSSLENNGNGQCNPDTPPRVTLNPECTGDCISGRNNVNTTAGVFINANNDPTASFTLGRFGLRAAGPTILQFVIGGAQGELGFTSPFNLSEINNNANAGRPACEDTVPEPELPATTILSCRNLIRMTAPPEFGNILLNLLTSADPMAPREPHSPEGKIQRGAMLFGIDLAAFANRMINDRMPDNGDGRDPNAINQQDRMLNCVGCHTPIHATGQSPSEVGARHLSFVWAPIFSDLLIHEMPEITPARRAPTPRLPFLRTIGSVETFDLARNLADDALPGQGIANGREFRTAPLMGMGRMGPPFLHDARIYLSKRTVESTPASTVYSNTTVGTNAPLVLEMLEDAIRAAIELHDLPAPDNATTPAEGGGGCPVYPGNQVGDVVSPPEGAGDICPSYDSDTSRNNRSEARNVLRRWRQLSAEDQAAVIEFLRQL
jgi:hypothetical protein